MKIPSLGQTGSIAASDSAIARRPKKQPVPNDHVQLTNLSAHLSSSQSNSPARLQRTSQLGAAVSSGSYHVDAGVLSNRIIEDHLSASRT